MVVLRSPYCDMCVAFKYYPYDFISTDKDLQAGFIVFGRMPWNQKRKFNLQTAGFLVSFQCVGISHCPSIQR